MFVSGGVPIDVEHLARQLRLDLKRAGIDRPQLFENNDKRQQVRAHDLRSTFVVVAEANGRSEAWITTRTGHKSSRMVAAYRRRGLSWKAAGLGDLLPLSEAIPDLFAPGLPPDERRGWDSNPRITDLQSAA